MAVISLLYCLGICGCLLYCMIGTRVPFHGRGHLFKIQNLLYLLSRSFESNNNFFNQMNKSTCHVHF